MNPRMKETWFNELGEYLALFMLMLIPLLITVGIYIDGSEVISSEYMLIGVMSFLFTILLITLIVIYVHDLYVYVYNRLLEWVISVSNDVSINNDFNMSNDLYEYVNKKVKKCKQ